MQGKTRPRIQYTKDFTHYIESVAGVAPPMPGIEGITGGGAHNGPALAGNEPAPKQANAPRVDFCRDQNHGLAIRERKRRGGNSDFVDGIHNGGFEDVNRFRRHSFVNQDESVVLVLADKRNAHFFQSFGGLSGMGKPDFRRVSFAVKFRCLGGAHGHRSAEHHDGHRSAEHHDCAGFPKRVFDHQPTAEAEENHQGKEQTGASNGGKDR